MVTTRLQAKTKPKRVRFADETSVTGEEDATQREELNGVPTESSVRLEADLSRVTAPNGTTPASPDAEDVDPLTVQRERRRRIATAQDEELRWANLKIVLRGEESTLYRAAKDALKMSDHFVLSKDDVLYYVGTRPLRRDQQQEDTMLRLVAPSTMIQEVLQNCHDSLEGGHQGIARTFYRVKLDYYWVGLYADVARHVRSCPDCSSSKSRPRIRGYSPGNILAERPFQVVSMDFVIPLPSRRGNTALLLFQCAFTGYVMGKAMADTTALRVAQAFEECMYQRFGAPPLIRHDRDPRFMSEVYQSFT
ncbi:reverse transcriptase [Phytophthora megakarya]|uniref:Reverse transcriptase n=1 Tax=Phytophthora megakarya TaxID=4795 RepID=A0A225UKF1_9STRA|nr:reverse transcriptase [Phytophthora megakarya]